jgi:hypothetical protein
MKKLYTFTTGQAIRRMFVLFAATLFVFSFVSSAGAAGLKTARADASEVQGTFTLMLYGCSSGSDVNNVAILKKEGGGDAFKIDAPDSEYAVKAGLDGREALAQAEKFLGCSVELDHTQLSKIMGPKGDVLGFEVKPQYEISRFGTPDAFETRYTWEGDSVTARIMPDPDIAREIQSGD